MQYSVVSSAYRRRLPDVTTSGHGMSLVNKLNKHGPSTDRYVLPRHPNQVPQDWAERQLRQTLPTPTASTFVLVLPDQFSILCYKKKNKSVFKF